MDKIFFQANSGRLVSIGHNGTLGNITQWDPSSGRLLETLEVKARYGIVAASPDLHWVAVNDSSTDLLAKASIQIVEARSGNVVREWPGLRLYFTPDSKRVAIGAYQNPELVFWDIDSGKKLETWKDASGLHYSPNGHRVTTNINEYVTIRDVDTGKTVQQLHTNSVVSKLVISAARRVESKGFTG